MGVKIRIVLVLILQQCNTFTAAETYSDIYPDISSCIEGKDQNAFEWVANKHSEAKEICTNGENPDETSLCYKICIFKERRILGDNYALYGSTSSEYLGLYAWEESETVKKKLEQARERVDECEKIENTHPGSDEKDCKDWNPKHHESVQKIVTCIENAVKC